MYEKLGSLLREALDIGQLPPLDRGAARTTRTRADGGATFARSYSVDTTPVAPPEVANAIMALGLGINASYDECRSAYKRLLLEYHPDTGGGKSAADKIGELKDNWGVIKGWFQSNKDK